MPSAETFTTDDVGNVSARSKSATSGQTIVWDAEGHEKSVTDKATGKKTEYLYDADGNRLIKRDQTSATTTLYVGGGETEYELKAGAVTARRNYSVDGEPIATRTTGKLAILIGDHHNSGQLEIDSTTLAVTKRRMGPFGITRTAGAWTAPRGFLNKVIDASTGTTHLDAREYDPKLGRFLSVDPVLDTGDPQQMNGYAYANNSPVTSSDPTGLWTDGGVETNRTAPVVRKRGGKSYAEQGGYYRNPTRPGKGLPKDSGGVSVLAKGGPNSAPIDARIPLDSGGGLRMPSRGFFAGLGIGIAVTACVLATAGICAPVGGGVLTAGAVGGASAAGTQYLIDEDDHSLGGFTKSVAIGTVLGTATAGASKYVRLPGASAGAVDDLLPGVRQGWTSRVADNGKGRVWQQPGATGNANSVRVMESTERYRNGYVRFYNDRGQPVGLNGKPGPNSETHIPRGPDGTYRLPEGW